MPKVKTKRAAKKRFKVTAKGRIKRWKASKSHLLVGKNAKRRRRLRRSDTVHPSDERMVKEYLRI